MMRSPPPHRGLGPDLGGCSGLGKAGATQGERGSTGFHDAYYKAQLAKIKGNTDGAKEALLLA